MPAFSDLNETIDFLFDSPTTDPATHHRDGVFSVLYYFGAS